MISTTVNTATFIGSGSAGPFTFNFPFLANTDMNVTVIDSLSVSTALVFGIDYALTGAGTGTGGSVTLTSALPVGSRLLIVRNTLQTQPTQYANQGAFYAQTHEDSFDRLTLVVQDKVTQGDVTIVSSATSAISASAYGGDLSAAITAIGADYATLEVDSAITVNANATVHANTQLVVNRPGMLTVASGKTLTINGPFVAGGYQVFAGTGNVAGLNESWPEWWGVDGTADNVQINAALAASKKVLLVPQKTYVCVATLTMNIFTTSLYGQNSKLDFSGLVSGNTFTFISTSGIAPYYQRATTIYGVELIGGGTGIGLYLHYPSPASDTNSLSHLTFEKVNIHHFATGIKFGDNTYAINFIGCDSHTNTGYGVDTLDEPANGGERICFVGCTIFGNNINVRQGNGAGNYSLTNCSLDYPTTCQIEIDNGQLHFTGCHLEGNAAYLMECGNVNTFVTFSDCLLIQQVSSGNTPYITCANYMNFFGGRIALLAGTAYPVKQTAGRFHLTGTHIQWEGAGNPFSCTSGFYYMWSEYGQSYVSNSQIKADALNTPMLICSRPVITLSAQNTWVVLGDGARQGMYIFRDGSVGGVAIFAVEPGATAQVFSNIAGGGFECGWSGTDFRIRNTTAATYPRYITVGQLFI
jgi:hypothetical protein